MSFDFSDTNRINNMFTAAYQQTLDTFRTLVNAIIPRSPILAYEYGAVQYYGALDLHTDEFVILTLNSLSIPLAQPVANLLNIAANSYEAQNPYNQFNVLTGLNLLKTDLSNLPLPFYNNPWLVAEIITSLLSYTMMGYYSEWAGYGSTRLERPNQRKLEYYPISWKQIGYPGPSLGYHALRAYSFT